MNKSMLKLAILEEIEKMMGEDAVIAPTGSGVTKDLYRRNMDAYSEFNEESACSECGGAMYEGECSECGYSKSMLNEGGCGCGTCAGCGDNDLDNDFVPDMLDQVVMFRDSDQGYSDTYGQNALSMDIDFPNHGGIQHHSHNNYMAKPSLYKVAKYSQKLLHMIPDGYELDDWQRTKIAQIADDISEVYHSLDYDFRDDEEY